MVAKMLAFLQRCSIVCLKSKALPWSSLNQSLTWASANSLGWWWHGWQMVICSPLEMAWKFCIFYRGNLLKRRQLKMYCCFPVNFKYMYSSLFKNWRAEAPRQKMFFKLCLLKERDILSKVLVQVGFVAEYLNEISSWKTLPVGRSECHSWSFLFSPGLVPSTDIPHPMPSHSTPPALPLKVPFPRGRGPRPHLMSTWSAPPCLWTAGWLR